MSIILKIPIIELGTGHCSSPGGRGEGGGGRGESGNFGCVTLSPMIPYWQLIGNQFSNVPLNTLLTTTGPPLFL